MKKGLNGFQIKLIALFFMTLDHIYANFSVVADIPILFTILGRIAAPLFIFMVTQGMRHTRSREKYLLRLWVGSVGMNVGNNVLNSLFPRSDGAVLFANIFSTMFVICLLIYGCEKIIDCFKNRNYKKVVGFSLLTLLPFIGSGLSLLLMSHMENPTMLLLFKFITTTIPSILFVEGGYIFVLLGIGFYLFGKNAKNTGIYYFLFSALIFISQVDISSFQAFLENNQWFMVLALPFLLLYNHEKGKSMKYLFYFYYPLHIYIFWIVSTFLV